MICFLMRKKRPTVACFQSFDDSSTDDMVLGNSAMPLKLSGNQVCLQISIVIRIR